jgi:hypothetical protein
MHKAAGTTAAPPKKTMTQYVLRGKWENKGQETPPTPTTRVILTQTHTPVNDNPGRSEEIFIEFCETAQSHRGRAGGGSCAAARQKRGVHRCLFGYTRICQALTGEK